MSRIAAFTTRNAATDGAGKFAKDLVLGWLILIFASLVLTHLSLAEPAFASRHDVRMEVLGSAFEPDATSLKESWAASLDALIEVLEPEPSTLRMTYRAGAEDMDLAHRRMEMLRRTVETRWASAARNYKLPIHIFVVYRNE